MGLPVYYTEQYSKGLGRTVSELLDELKEINPIEKSTFSCFGADNILMNL